MHPDEILHEDGLQAMWPLQNRARARYRASLVECSTRKPRPPDKGILIHEMPGFRLVETTHNLS